LRLFQVDLLHKRLDLQGAQNRINGVRRIGDGHAAGIHVGIADSFELFQAVFVHHAVKP